MTTLNFVPQLNWKLDGGESVAWESFVNVDRFRVGVNALTTTLLGEAPAYPNTHIRMSNNYDALSSALKWKHVLASGAKLDMKFGVSASRTENISDRDADGNPAVGPLGRSIASRGRDHGVNGTGKLIVPLWEGHALAVGWDGRINRRDDERNERDTLDPSLAVPGGDKRYAGQIARLAAYAQDEWNLTPLWSMYLGARWEGVRIRADGSDFGSTRANAGVFSPVLQTLYKLPNSKGDQLRMALSRTYRAPSMDQLLPRRYTSVNNSQVEPDTLGNPNLKPELALGVNAAWEHPTGPKARCCRSLVRCAASTTTCATWSSSTGPDGFRGRSTPARRTRAACRSRRISL